MEKFECNLPYIDSILITLHPEMRLAITSIRDKVLDRKRVEADMELID